MGLGALYIPRVYWTHAVVVFLIMTFKFRNVWLRGTKSDMGGSILSIPFQFHFSGLFCSTFNSSGTQKDISKGNKKIWICRIGCISWLFQSACSLPRPIRSYDKLLGGNHVIISMITSTLFEYRILFGHILSNSTTMHTLALLHW